MRRLVTFFGSRVFLPFTRLAPRGHRRTTRGVVLALAAAVRVVDRVHDRTTDGRTNAGPAVTTGLTDLDVGVLSVANLTDGGAAGDEDATHLGRRHAKDGVATLLAHQLAGVASGTGDGSATARLELDGVDERTDRNLGQRHGVAGLDVGALAGNDGVADAETLRAEDVRLGAVSVVKQRDASGTVRVVLDGSNLGGHAILATLEVDNAVTTLVAAALVTGGHATVVVATGLLRQRLEKRLLGLVRRDLGEVRDRLEAPACAGRLEVLNSHVTFPFLGPLAIPLKG